MALTAPTPGRVVAFVILALAAAVGVLAVVEPKFAIAAAIGLAFVVLGFADVTAGLCLFVAATFLDEIPSFAGLSVAKAAGALLVVSWVAAVATRRGERQGLAASHPGLAVGLALLACWAAASALWAQDPGASLAGAQRWALNLALFPIVFTAVDAPRTVRWIFAIFVLGGLLTAVATTLGLAGAGSAAASEGRLASADVNPNALGGVLVVASVFAGALAAGRDRSAAARALWFIAGALTLTGLALTLSRGALIGMVVAFLVAPFAAGPGRRTLALTLAVVACGTLALSIVAFVPDEATQRLTSSDKTGSGRTDIWRVGWRMVQDHPVVGVGADNFDKTSIRYLVRPGVIQQDEFIVNTPKVAHNVYLQVLAELGVIGLGLFLTIIGLCLRTTLRAAGNFARAGDRSADLLARALFVSLVAMLASAFFSSEVYSKPVFLLLALGPALLNLSRRPLSTLR